MILRYGLWLISSIALAGQAVAADNLLFSERVALAKKIEEQPATAEYFKNEMFPAIGSALASSMRDCLSHPKASTKKFSVVADVSQEGRFTRVAYEPKTNTSRCLATAMATFRAPPPPTCDCGALPIVIEMSVTP